MRIVHDRFIRYLRRLCPRLPNATSYHKGDSPMKNVRPHLRHRFFYLLDIRNAYGTVDVQRLTQTLFNRDMAFWGYRVENTFAFLQAYCTYPTPEPSVTQTDVRRSGLIIGAPASPILFNIYAGIRIDEALASLCEKHGLTYTRYIDDLTFSSPKVIGLRVRRQIRNVIQATGFGIHDWKARVIDLRRQSSVLITGVGVKLDGTVFLPRHYVKKLRGLIHAANRSTAITPPMVEGRMGLFRAVMGRRAPNRTEQTLLNAYHKWRAGTYPAQKKRKSRY